MNRLAWAWTIPAAVLAVAEGCQKDSGIAPVRTLNAGYERMSARALVREVPQPTRARLDYAAYASNVMLWDRSPEIALPKPLAFGDMAGGFLLPPGPSLEGAPLTAAEKASPLHWKPALDHLMEKDFETARPLAEAYASLVSRRFGFSGDVPAPLAEAADLYLARQDSSAWVKVEIKPWVKPLSAEFADSDGDGFPEAYARLDPSVFTSRHFRMLAGDYSQAVLDEDAVLAYGHTLAAYWYPSRNTDFQDLRGSAWPSAGVEGDVRQALGSLSLPRPLFALRGKPHGSPLYFVITVPGMGNAKPAQTPAHAQAAENRNVSENVGEYLAAIEENESALLDRHGKGSWEAWVKKLDPFRQDLRVKAEGAGSALALQAGNGFLVFRREVEYLLADDLGKLPEPANPLAAIAALRDSLAGLGIDFLFVPVPTKQDVYPDLLSKARLPDGVAQPWVRKLFLDLAKRKVETVDLFTPLRSAASGKDTLYQRQDTHWTTQGLEKAAAVLAERILGYAWFGEAFPEEVRYAVRDTVFSQRGDLPDRMPPESRAAFKPENLLGRRVFLPDGKPYEDEADSPVLVLGDSYTGVFQLTGCRNAGVTAHIAKDLGGPVDLIQGWGGGPEAPNKLRRGGPEALQGKRLVVWLMSVRDLFVYPGGWNPPKS